MSDIYPIDLRSDTVTKPSDAMRSAMSNAIVGDDVFSEDPTVTKLQERVAEILGKEAALFVPSGTMANQVCLAAQTQRGDEVLLDDEAHILHYEGGGPALLSGLQLRAIAGDFGRITAEQIEQNIHGGASHIASTTMVCLENTHNRGGGTIYEPTELRKIYETAKMKNLSVHLDGARLWNASASTGIPESEYAKYADSVGVTFSKGLGAPIGSAVAGSKEFVAKAHRYRKIFGGGMRQAGVIAAAAVYALENNRQRLSEDHEKASVLAKKLLESGKVRIEGPVQSNILVITYQGSVEKLVEDCYRDGILFFQFGKNKFRLVTHMDVSMTDVKKAADIILNKLQ